MERCLQLALGRVVVAEVDRDDIGAARDRAVPPQAVEHGRQGGEVEMPGAVIVLEAEALVDEHDVE
ncbi:unannotated protein [freshwater metagenome]|uniref:Unannotated protein n=1 Tax=freshwater metagenome TaxID=449393 RepID=A0A6J7Q1S8_9ZZZZ